MAATYYDIVGELNVRNIDSVTDTILFYLDVTSLKSVGLVSKAWRNATLVALRTIMERGNPNWSSQQKRLWSMAGTHLSFQCPMSQEDPHFKLRVANSRLLAFERMQRGFKGNLDLMTLDYQPFDFKCGGDNYAQLADLEISENFIVIYEFNKLSYWSRRTLLPLKLDQEFLMRKYKNLFYDMGMAHKLFGNFLYNGDIVKSNDSYPEITITKTDLDARSQGIIEGSETVIRARAEPCNNKAKGRDGVRIRLISIVEDFIMIVFLYQDAAQWSYRVSLLWKAEEAEGAEIDLRPTQLRVPFFHHGYKIDFFFDANYLVVKWIHEDEDEDEDENEDLEEDDDDDEYEDVDEDDDGSGSCGFRTFSIHPTKPGQPVEFHLIASFTIKDCIRFEYKDGILAAASADGMITFVDVAKGVVLRKALSPVKFAAFGNDLKLAGGYLVCVSRVLENVFKGTFFLVWDLESIIGPEADKGTPGNRLDTPVCIFDSLTGTLFEVRVDELGIVVLMENDPERAIQVLSFVPTCNGCKRVTNPALLKKCSVCEYAAYCSEECRAADWDPHHKAICGKVDPKKFIQYQQ